MIFRFLLKKNNPNFAKTDKLRLTFTAFVFKLHHMYTNVPYV